MSTPLWLSLGLLRIRPAPVAVAIKRLLRIRRQWVRTPRGWFLVDPVSNFGLALLRDGEYEPQMVATLETCLPAEGTFVDLGANEGYFSVIASVLVGPAGRVLAIEPQSRVQSVLTENLRRNQAMNVRLEERAVSDCAGVAIFHLSPDTNSGSSGLLRTTRYRGPTLPVQTARLADILESHRLDTVDLLKIDIEGYEHETVFGSSELFRDGRVRHVAVEIHPKQLQTRGHDVNAVPTFLEKCGYRRLDGFASVFRRDAS